MNSFNLIYYSFNIHTILNNIVEAFLMNPTDENQNVIQSLFELRPNFLQVSKDLTQIGKMLEIFV
jgi:hypothetical protein